MSPRVGDSIVSSYAWKHTRPEEAGDTVNSAYQDISQHTTRTGDIFDFERKIMQEIKSASLCPHGWECILLIETI